MKQRVVLRTFSIVTSLICVAIFVALMFIGNPPQYVQISLAVILVIMLLSGLFYMPMSVGANKTAIQINFSLRIKIIPMQDVKSVKICQPTMGAIRICGSSGFMGYWGWFKERDLGKYFAYYGRSRDCFLVELKNGRKYMLGCNNATQMVEHIEGFLR